METNKASLPNSKPLKRIKKIFPGPQVSRFAAYNFIMTSSGDPVFSLAPRPSKALGWPGSKYETVRPFSQMIGTQRFAIRRQPFHILIL